jgi:hypothetical protein
MHFSVRFKTSICRYENYIGPKLRRELEGSLGSLSISVDFDRFLDYYRIVRERARNVTLCVLFLTCRYPCTLLYSLIWHNEFRDQ